MAKQPRPSPTVNKTLMRSPKDQLGSAKQLTAHHRDQPGENQSACHLKSSQQTAFDISHLIHEHKSLVEWPFQSMLSAPLSGRCFDPRSVKVFTPTLAPANSQPLLEPQSPDKAIDYVSSGLTGPTSREAKNAIFIRMPSSSIPTAVGAAILTALRSSSWDLGL
ncbi:hypothetical protein E4U23_006287 [Claviceps purpurea]|nr:hypothetical protein E4U51_002062 [Claviceps purpurea]KAG6244260.1 hypothetical protein E4U23_006287 [Claviceps purpurea]